MSMLYLAGRYFNVFGRTNAVVSVSPTESSVAPKAGLYDLDPSTPHMAGSIAADSYMRVQINALTNPGFETYSGFFTGWTNGSIGTGTAVSDPILQRTGVRGAALLGADSSNYGSAYQLITVQAGEFRQASAWIKRSTGTAVGRIFLYNTKTGNYYNGSAWASTRASAVNGTASGTYAQITVSYQLESFDVCRADTVSLRWEIECESAGTTTFDDCLDIPGVTFASIHGHNYGPVIPLVQSSDDGAAWTTRATMTVKRPAFFSTFSIIYAEWWQFKLSGTNHEAPYTGEAVLGQYQTSTVQPLWNPIVDRMIPGTRQFGTAARPSAYSYCTDPTESIGMEFLAANATAEKDLYDNLWLRSREGEYPVIVVPRDDETAVYFGHLMRPYSSARPFGDARPTSLYLIGAPFPTVGL